MAFQPGDERLTLFLAAAPEARKRTVGGSGEFLGAPSRLVEHGQIKMLGLKKRRSFAGCCIEVQKRLDSFLVIPQCARRAAAEGGRQDAIRHRSFNRLHMNFLPAAASELAAVGVPVPDTARFAGPCCDARARPRTQRQIIQPEATVIHLIFTVKRVPQLDAPPRLSGTCGCRSRSGH